MPRHVRTDAQRKQARAGRGTLHERRISTACKLRYTEILSYCFWCLPYLGIKWAKDWPTRDQQVCIFLECLYAEGEAKSRAGDLISALQWHYSVRHVLGGSWKRFFVWNNLEPSEATPPLPV